MMQHCLLRNNKGLSSQHLDISSTQEFLLRIFGKVPHAPPPLICA